MTWSRFFDADESMHALVAEVAGRIVGLPHFLYHRSTTQTELSGYLSDRFTANPVRGRVMGRTVQPNYPDWN